MSSLTVRDLDEDLLDRLKAAARAHHRSLAGEVRAALAAYVTTGDQQTVRLQRLAWLTEVRSIAERSRPGPGLSEILHQAREEWDPAERRP